MSPVPWLRTHALVATACLVCALCAILLFATSLGRDAGALLAVVGFTSASVVLDRIVAWLTNDRGRGYRSRWFICVTSIWVGSCAAAPFLAIWLAPDPWAFGWILVVSLATAGLVAAPLVLWNGLVLRSRRDRPQDALALLTLVPILLLSVPTCVAVGRIDWWATRNVFHDAAGRLQPVIAAIERYAIERGEPPPDLAALVPTYLPEVPGTGLRAYPDLEYWRRKDGWGLRIDCGGFLNWDEFYYPPKPGDGRRSDHELINGWVYYHE